MKSKSNIVDSVKEAINKNQIKVYYQPIYAKNIRSVYGYEALARWEHPEHGIIEPSEFVPQLEEAGHIDILDKYVAEIACREISLELDTSGTALPVAINISPSEFSPHNDTVEHVLDLIHKYRVPADMIPIEFTESSQAEKRAELKALAQFHEKNIQVWLDDFGTGFNTLKKLKDMNFDGLKIDICFVQDVSEKSKQIIRSIVTLAKKLGMITIAEGIETEEQLQFLREIGCDRFQGYYLGRPQKNKHVISERKDA